MDRSIKARHYGNIYPSQAQYLTLSDVDHYHRELRLAETISEHTYEELAAMRPRDNAEWRWEVKAQIAIPFGNDGSIEGVVDTGENYVITLSEPLEINGMQRETLTMRYIQAADMDENYRVNKAQKSEFDRSIDRLITMIDEIPPVPTSKTILLDMPVKDYLRIMSTYNLDFMGMA